VDLGDCGADSGVDRRRQPLPDPLGVEDLTADEQRARWQDAQAAGERQGALRGRVVHVGEGVASLGDGQGGDVVDVRLHDEHGPGRPAEVEGVDDDEGVGGLEQLLHEVDPADADLEDVHAVGQRRGEQPRRDGVAEAVVAAEHVAEAGDEDAHGCDDSGVEDEISQLRAQLLRYRADRFPLEHATIQFHLAVALIGAERSSAAAPLLRAAAGLFAELDRPVEEAKATNMLGVALRALGESGDAIAAFEHAAEAFATHGLALEEGAARYNLGLVRTDSGDVDAAGASFRAALDVFAAAGAAAQAASAARELGAALLAQGDAPGAVVVLDRAVALADEARDTASLGAAANALGLARLHADEIDAAIAALRRAVAANPRTLRRDEFAMAKANLALAYERAGDVARARLAAAAALGVPHPPAPVAAQATAVLERLGSGDGDLLVVLDDEPPERWTPILREEFARWADADDGDRDAALVAWVRGHLDRPTASAELAHVYVDVLLELPPQPADAIMSATVRALAALPQDAAARFRNDVSRAMVVFGIPQWLRLRDTLNRFSRAELWT
jgi:tetratricopeptide (TPR) repeat protein